MSDSSVIIVDLDVRGEREITRLADALKRWLHQQELTADIDTGRRVFTPNANCGTIAVCPRCSNKVSDWVDIANDTLTAWVEYRGEDGVATARTPAAFRSGHGVTANRGRSEN